MTQLTSHAQRRLPIPLLAAQLYVLLSLSPLCVVSASAQIKSSILLHNSHRATARIVLYSKNLSSLECDESYLHPSSVAVEPRYFASRPNADNPHIITFRQTRHRFPSNTIDRLKFIITIDLSWPEAVQLQSDNCQIALTPDYKRNIQFRLAPGHLTLPPLTIPGDIIHATPRSSTKNYPWTLVIGTSAISATRDSAFPLRFDIPFDSRPDHSISAFLGPLHADIQLRLADPPYPQPDTVIEAAAWSETDNLLCLCGWFPDFDARAALLINNKEAPELIASSVRTIIAKIPPSLDPDSLRSRLNWLSIPDQKHSRVGALLTPISYYREKTGICPCTTIDPNVPSFHANLSLAALWEDLQPQLRSAVSTLTNGKKELEQITVDQENIYYYSASTMKLIREALSVLTVLNAATALIPFRQYVSDSVEEALSSVEKSSIEIEMGTKALSAEFESASFVTTGDLLFSHRFPALFLSKLTGSGPKRLLLLKSIGDKILVQLMAFFTEVLDRESGLLSSICIATIPPGANVRLFPSAYPSAIQEFATNNGIEDTPMGEYTVEITMGNFEDVRMVVDLVRDSRPVLSCELQTADPNMKFQQFCRRHYEVPRQHRTSLKECFGHVE